MLALSIKVSFSVNIAKFGQKINNKSNDGGKYLAISCQTPCTFSLKGGSVINQYYIGGILGIILQVGIYVCIGLERSRKKEDE